MSLYASRLYYSSYLIGHPFGKLDPDPHQREKQDPDPHKSEKQDPETEKVQQTEQGFE
jgi:hypothetical protein